jgi:hypothetical protein
MPGIRPKSSGTGKRVRAGKTANKSALSPDTVLRAYAGKYVAWAPNGITIIAVASSFDAAERKAAKAGYPMAAIARIPRGRTIN